MSEGAPHFRNVSQIIAKAFQIFIAENDSIFSEQVRIYEKENLSM